MKKPGTDMPDFNNSTGRNDEIWTHDPYHPKVVHYQAVLHPDQNKYITFLSF